MSLENAIMNLVEAVQANTAALEANTAAQGGEVAEAPAKPAKAAPAKAAPAKAAPAKGKAKAAPVEEEEEDDGGFGGEEEEGEAEDITLDDVKVALQRYAKAEGKPAAMEILKKYGVSNIAKLDEGDFGPIVEEIEGLLA